MKEFGKISTIQNQILPFLTNFGIEPNPMEMNEKIVLLLNGIKIIFMMFSVVGKHVVFVKLVNHQLLSLEACVQDPS